MLVIILLLLIVLVFMCGFMISQSSPAECSATATGATNASLTATDNQMYQLCNESLVNFAQEIHNSIGNIVNGTTYVNHTENLIKLNNSFHSIDASIENSTEILSLIQTSLNNNKNFYCI